ncbi:ABC transporter permease [Corynebacterium falsenii]|uniref:ABC transporter permease n=1 Tax=Corynebacterium falsenii TaxID=108486 RepID=UPI003FD62B3D
MKTVTRIPAQRAWTSIPLRLAGVITLVAIWWLVTELASINPVILPTPAAVVHDLVYTNFCVHQGGSLDRPQCGVQGYFLWQHLLATIERIAVGLIAAAIVGIVLGWLLGTSPVTRAIVEPYLSFLRALPPLGYMGLLIVWFGVGDFSKVILLFLAVFPTVTVATTSGVVGVKRDWILAATTLGASRWQVFSRVIIPAALPNIIDGIRIGAGLAWSAIVAAEMSDGIPGVGGLAYISGTQLDTALTIASIITIGIAALVLDRLFVAVEKRYTPWRGQ